MNPTKFTKEFTSLPDGRIEEKQTLEFMNNTFVNFITEGIKFCNYEYFADQIIRHFDIEEDSNLSEDIIEACNELDFNTEYGLRGLNNLSKNNFTRIIL